MKLNFYKEYLQTAHWQNIKECLIYFNSKAECWICQKTYTLLPHHFQYKNLHKEKRMIILLFFVFGDLAVICFDCHTNLHWIPIKIFFIKFRIRTPVKRFFLLARMFYLRYIICVQRRQFRRLLLTNLYYITSQA